MDEYDQFDLEYAKRLIIRGLLGATIATILSAIAYLLVLPENAFRIFKGVSSDSGDRRVHKVLEWPESQPQAWQFNQFSLR